MRQGTIRMYKDDRGFGFIRPDDGSEDVFFHISCCRYGVLPIAGAKVSYETGIDPKTNKFRAVEVSLT